MRKAVTVAVALFLGLTFACERRQPEPTPASLPVPTPKPITFTINSTATGWGEITPSVARFSLTVEVRQLPELVAEARVDESVQAVLAILSEKGVALGDTTVSRRKAGFATGPHPVYVYPGASVHVEFRDLPRAGETLAALTEVPYIRLGVVSLEAEGEPHGYAQNATDNAKWLARRQAEETALARGCSPAEFAAAERDVIRMAEGKIVEQPLPENRTQTSITFGDLTFPAQILVVRVKVTLTFDLVCSGIPG